MEVSKWWKKSNFQKFKLKWKIVKHFYKAQTVSHLQEIIQPPPEPTTNHIKSHYLSRTNIFLRIYTEIYRHLLSKCFKNAALGRQEMGQCKCFFWHQIETCLLENLKSQKDFWLYCGSILFLISSLIHKMNEAFWAKVHCKISYLFSSFC